jgi:pimeloyl-ACP methyl ester carboxylesterase
VTRTTLVEAGPATIEVLADGAGPLVVLAPSAGRGGEDLAAVTAELVGRGLRVLRPQPRGLGRSTGPMTGLTYADWAADLAAAVAADDTGPAVLIGHAAGGRYARVCAARFPALVRGVVVAAAAADPPAAHLGRELMLAADPGEPVEIRLAALRRSFFAPGRDPTAWLEGWSPATLAAQRASTPVPEWHTAGSVPMLDLIAANDAWRPAPTRGQLVDRLGDRVTVAVIENTGHALLPENPVAVAETIASWLDREYQ